jgi:hypothetical protein
VTLAVKGAPGVAQIVDPSSHRASSTLRGRLRSNPRTREILPTAKAAASARRRIYFNVKGVGPRYCNDYSACTLIWESRPIGVPGLCSRLNNWLSNRHTAWTWRRYGATCPNAKDFVDDHPQSERIYRGSVHEQGEGGILQLDPTAAGR